MNLFLLSLLFFKEGGIKSLTLLCVLVSFFFFFSDLELIIVEAK